MGGEQIARDFANRFGHEPQVIAVAPGRVNLIGEHTDYNGGFVFPAAIDKQLTIAASLADGETLLFSEELQQGQAFDAASVEPGQVEGWATYAAGMAWALREDGARGLPNIRAVLTSDIPIGSGISSSAAIELAFAVVWNELANLHDSNVHLARLGQRCENSFVGVNSGIMDQMASAMGKAGHAMFLDTRTLEIEYAPIPEQLVIVICDTGKPRALTDSAYNERRAQCESACVSLGVGQLREATMADLDAQNGKMDPLIYKRARHVITENDRCQHFKVALERGDLAAIGELMKASHESLRDDYEVSSAELDAMAESAWNSPGCIGARMTGAGFGGACVALVDRERLEQFGNSVRVAYTAKTAIEGQYLPCAAVDGAHAVKT